MYIYESHLGGLYLDRELLGYDFLYCEECGAADCLVGEAKDFTDVWDFYMGHEGANMKGKQGITPKTVYVAAIKAFYPGRIRKGRKDLKVSEIMEGKVVPLDGDCLPLMDYPEIRSASNSIIKEESEEKLIQLGKED